jgi:hypothetical protein
MQPAEARKYKILAENILSTGLIVLCFMVSAITIYMVARDIQNINQFLDTKCKIESVGSGLCNLTCTHHIEDIKFQDKCPQYSDYRVIYDAGEYRIGYLQFSFVSFIYFVVLALVMISTTLISFVFTIIGIGTAVKHISNWSVASLALLLHKIFTTNGIKIE